MLRIITSALALLAALAGELPAQQKQEKPNKVSATAPNNAHVATAQGRTIHVAEAQTGKLLLAMTAHEVDVVSLAFSPDGKLLAGADKSGRVVVFDAEIGKRVWKAESNLRGEAGKLKFSADGRELGFTVGKKTSKYEAVTGKASK